MAFSTPPISSLLRVAELGSVSRAATALHLSQPAVTKQLRSLEESLGVALVERSGRGVQLTQAGQLVVRYARQSEGLFDECRARLEELRAGRAGRLSLGSTVTTSIILLPRWLRELRRREPGLEIIVHTGTSRVIEEAVLERRFDFGIVTSAPESREVIARVLYREPIILVIARELPLPRRDALEQIGLISFPRTSGFRAFLDAKIGAERMLACTKMESDSLEVIKSFVTAGIGGAFLPLSAVREELAKRSLVQVQGAGLPRLARATRLIRRRDRTPTAAGRLFLEVLGVAR